MRGELLVLALLLLFGSMGSLKPKPPRPAPKGRMNLSDLRSLAASVGFPDPVTAAAIAMAESGGDPCAQGDPNIGARSCIPNGRSTSFGLWQIHVTATMHTQYDPLQLLEADYNARAALAVSSNGTDWKPWSTAWEDPYKSGYLGPKAPYRKFMLGG